MLEEIQDKNALRIRETGRQTDNGRTVGLNRIEKKPHSFLREIKMNDLQGRKILKQSGK